MLLMSCMKIFLFRVDTKLQEIGFVFEDPTLQGGLPEEHHLTGTVSCFSLAQAKGLSILVVV